MRPKIRSETGTCAIASGSLVNAGRGRFLSRGSTLQRGPFYLRSIYRAFSADAGETEARAGRTCTVSAFGHVYTRGVRPDS